MTLAFAPPQSGLYRAVWRWHFVAGLLSLPFLFNLAVTGAAYLFAPEIDRALYRSLTQTPACAQVPLAASDLVARAASATDGEVARLTPPAGPQTSVEMLILREDGARMLAYLDPCDGRLIGTRDPDGVMQIVRKIHSLQFFGFWASALVEIAAGWTIVLALSGLYLWWPRGQGGGVASIRATPASRLFWRDLHAVTGAFASLVILFLALTGMPWSMVWGRTVQGWATSAGLGRPTPPVEFTPEWAQSAGKGHADGHGRANEPTGHLPWALEMARPPDSAPAPQPRIPLDQALARFDAAGLLRPYDLSLPQGPKGAFTATARAGRVDDARTIYLDQYSGAILDDVGFERYGPAARVIEWGVAVHQGQQYGWANRLLMLAGCLAIVALTISAPVMWWKRRPKGSLGLPPKTTDARAAGVVLAIVAVAGLVFPLVELSILVGLAVEGVYRLAGRSPRSA